MLARGIDLASLGVFIVFANWIPLLFAVLLRFLSGRRKLGVSDLFARLFTFSYIHYLGHLN
jgi:hypothetical protein